MTAGAEKRADQAVAPARGHEEHKSGSWLRDLILGGQDGLVNILGIVLGVSAATGSVQVLIAAALAATFAESISMGAVAYTSTLAERDYYQSELERERGEMREMPDIERDEIRQIYAEKGFKGELLDRIVETITSDEELWLNEMMSQELRLEPVDTHAVLRTALIVTAATLIGSLIPLLPFFILPRIPALVTAIGVSVATLFGVGAYKALSLVGDWRRSGVQMVLIGMGAALAGFAVGRIFHASA